jgi:hypothetical protein
MNALTTMYSDLRPSQWTAPMHTTSTFDSSLECGWYCPDCECLLELLDCQNHQYYPYCRSLNRTIAKSLLHGKLLFDCLPPHLDRELASWRSPLLAWGKLLTGVSSRPPSSRRCCYCRTATIGTGNTYTHHTSLSGTLLLPTFTPTPPSPPPPPPTPPQW